MSNLTPRINDLESRDTQTDGKIAKNVIINGGFDFWQRGTSFTALASAEYFADRFIYINSSTAVHTASRDTDVPNDDLAYSSLFTLTTPDAALTATQLCTISHRVEGYFFRDLKDKKFMLSFWVKATKTGTASICFRNQTGRNYVTTYTIDASNTWERKTIKVQHDSTGTWNYENGTGLDILFILESGPDNKVSTLDQWVSNPSALCADTQDNFVETGSDEFRLTGIMLTEDTGEPDFDPEFQRAGRNYQEEEQLCQRYYERITGSSFTLPCRTIGGGTLNFAVYRYKTRKRAPAVFSASADSTFRVIALGSSSLIASILQSQTYEDFFELRINSSVNFGTNVVTTFNSVNIAAFLAFDAEL